MCNISDGIAEGYYINCILWVYSAYAILDQSYCSLHYVLDQVRPVISVSYHTIYAMYHH